DNVEAIHIVLKASSPKVRIVYTLDGSTPGDSNGITYVDSIPLDTNATLKAVALSRQPGDTLRGAPLAANYTFFAAGRRTLNPGTRLDLTSQYSLSNPVP